MKVSRRRRLFPSHDRASTPPTRSQRSHHLARMSRRQVIRLLIGGGALAIEAGGVGAFSLGLASKLGKGIHPSPSLHSPAGAIIGQKTQARNTARYFINPKDGKQSLLVHLPDGKFVAYEQACTHRGVFVDYDPATHRLVCPAHGA